MQSLWRGVGIELAWSALSLTAGCAKEVKAYVECAPAGVGINCTITHQQGSAKAHVCWDYKVVCKNGVVSVTSTCADVAPEAKVTKMIPLADMPNSDKCDLGVSNAVENLRITAAQ